ncbi:MAG TPA: hypothetical protein VH396_03340 [Chitinophagaceae bacterium]|jgi:hypothetical protein
MLVQILLIIVSIYLACGFVFMIPFIIKGADIIDEGAHGSSIGFRIIIIPGTIVFWPILFRKWIRAKKIFMDQAEVFK